MRRLHAFLRLDLRNLRGDALLSVVLVSRLALALALRWGYPQPSAGPPRSTPCTSCLVVVHVAFLFGMLGGLLVLDDADDGALLALRVSP